MMGAERSDESVRGELFKHLRCQMSRQYRILMISAQIKKGLAKHDAFESHCLSGTTGINLDKSILPKQNV